MKEKKWFYTHTQERFCRGERKTKDTHENQNKEKTVKKIGNAR